MQSGYHRLGRLLRRTVDDLARDARRYSGAAGLNGGPAPLHVAVVGSGPAGFYTVDRLLRSFGDGVKVDLLDRLPTPFGLVRSGVAPDHPETKNVIHQFTDTARDSRVTFLGNVTVGRDVGVEQLRQLYHAVIFCYGAESDRRLNIPGEDSAGVFSAREFVWWYNGHPDARDLPVDLSHVHTVAICGLGNVALDCARLLLRPARELAATDIAAHAYHQLAERSAVREVHIFARRGPVQAACTPKELKELVNTTGLKLHMGPEQLAVSPEDEAEMRTTRLRRRVYDLFKQGAAKDVPDAVKALYIQTYRNPREIVADADGRAAAIKVETTMLQTQPGGGGTVAVGTGKHETVEAQLVLKSIGYKSIPVDGLPFDHRRGVVPNRAGRVLAGNDTVTSSSSKTVPGLYVSGWLKRGPTGIIGTNLQDAEETVASLRGDADNLVSMEPGARGTQGLLDILSSSNVCPTRFADWEKLDEAEVARGKQQGKPREKVVDLCEMKHILRSPM